MLASTEAGVAPGVSDIVMMDARALSAAIAAKTLSCVEVMTAYLDHIAALNPKVNAIVALQDRDALLALARERDASLARGESLGALHGLPIAGQLSGPGQSLPVVGGLTGGLPLAGLGGLTSGLSGIGG